MRGWWWLLCGAVAACNSKPVRYDLDAAPSLALRLDGTIGYVVIGVTAANPADADCLHLSSDLQATLGGVPMLVDPGTNLPADDDSCGAPVLSVDLESIVPASSELVMFDDTGSLHATYPDHLFERRAMTLRSPSTWQAHPGDEIHLGWSHPADFALIPPTVQLNLNGGVAWIATGSLVGDEVVFTVPATATMSGSLRLGPPDATGEASKCEPGRCTYTVKLYDDHVLTITP